MTLRTWLDRHPALRRWRGAAAPPPVRPPLRLALQGGGAHGAFTWGVLDALLERPDVPLAAASGASAGALNAVLLAHGLAAGGAGRPGHGTASAAARDAAREALATFWLGMARESPFERHGHWLLRGDPRSPRLSPAARWLFDWSARFTPQQLNPQGLHPLRDLLSAQVDFERLRDASPLPLFVAATHVTTAEPRVFREHELDVDVLLASTCLPRLHHPVIIGGEAYWDGGYSANPPLAPLLFDLPADADGGCDVLLVTLSPTRVETVPVTARDIAHRQLDLAFGVPLMGELRWLQRLQQEARRGGPPLPWTGGTLRRRLLRMRVHRIAIDCPPRADSDDDGEAPVASTDPEGKLIANVSTVQALRDAGRAAAHAWLAGDRGDATVSAPLPSSSRSPPPPAGAP